MSDVAVRTSSPQIAVDIYKQAIQANPDDVQIYFSLALYYLRLEMVDKADEVLAKMIEMDRDGKYSKALKNFINLSRLKEIPEEVRTWIKELFNNQCSYKCSVCNCQYSKWQERCVSCKNWNTIARC